MALSADVKIVRYGSPGNASQPAYPGAIAASTTVYAGSIALTNSNGAIKNAASPVSTDVCWGLIHSQTVNSSTASQTGLILDTLGNVMQIDTGSFFVSYTTSGAQAITQSNVGQVVYVVNETTVGANSAGNTLPAAGVLLTIDTTQPGGAAVKFGSAQSSGAPQ